jgi:NAD-dependent oxidoreductase involved in siderophore biosynthesis
MYSVMAIFKSSIVWGLFEYTEFFIASQRKSGGERSRDLGGQMVVEMILSANTLSNSVIDMCCMCRSAILPKAGLVNFIIFQLCNEGIHNIVTVPLGVESLREKNGSDYAPM